MPIHKGSDNKGKYYQWGGRTKYYFGKSTGLTENDAYRKALKQAQAAYAHGYRD